MYYLTMYDVPFMYDFERCTIFLSEQGIRTMEQRQDMYYLTMYDVPFMYDFGKCTIFLSEQRIRTMEQRQICILLPLLRREGNGRLRRIITNYP